MTILAVLTIFSAAITVVLYAVPLYDLAMEKLEIAESTGLSPEVIKSNYRILIRYNLLWGPGKLAFTDFASSPSGLAHFSDVKNLFRHIQILALFGIPACFLGYLITRKMRVYSWMRNTCILASGIILGIVSGLLLDAEGTFIFMHRILFRNVYWQFNPAKDPIIKILPAEFFLYAAIEVLILIAAALLILLIRYGLLIRKERVPVKRKKTEHKKQKR